MRGVHAIFRFRAQFCPLAELYWRESLLRTRQPNQGIKEPEPEAALLVQSFERRRGAWAGGVCVAF